MKNIATQNICVFSTVAFREAMQVTRYPGQGALFQVPIHLHPLLHLQFTQTPI